MLIIIVVLSICIDSDWLASHYFVASLREEADYLAFRIEQEESLTRAFAWYGLMINIFLKMTCLNVSMKSSLQGRSIRNKLWERGHVFIPPLMKQLPKDFDAAVRARVIAITWIELICSILFFAYFFVILFDGVAATHFQASKKQMFSLQGILILKGTSGIFVVLSLAHHLRLKDFFSQFGCTFICPTIFETQSRTRSRGRSKMLSTMKKSLSCILFVKTLDFGVGVLLWISLVSARKILGWDAPKEVTTMMDLILTTNLFTNNLVPFLIIIVAW